MRTKHRFAAKLCSVGLALCALFAAWPAVIAPAYGQVSAAPAKDQDVRGTGVVLSNDWSNRTITFLTNAHFSDDSGTVYSHFYEFNTFIGEPSTDHTRYWARGFGDRDNFFDWGTSPDVQRETSSPTMQQFLQTNKVPVWQLQVQHLDDPGPTGVKHVKIRFASSDGRFQLVINASYTDESTFNECIAATADFLSSMPNDYLEENVRNGTLLLFAIDQTAPESVAYSDGQKRSTDADSFTPIIAPTNPIGQAIPSPLGHVSATGGS